MTLRTPLPELPDARMRDPAFLAASMHEGQYISSGTNNDVWRIDGLAGDASYILRVSNIYRPLFLDVTQPPRMEVCAQAALDARAAQPIAMFFARDAQGKEHAVADIQPELKGDLLGMTRDEMESRTNRIKEVLTQTDEWGRVAGNIVTRRTPNQQGVERTNARLWPLAERIAAMPVRFFIQTIKDAKEIEENGYGIDPSKGANFMLLDGQERIGFMDLVPQDQFQYRLTPDAIATVLWQPANQTWGGADNPEQEARRKILNDIISAKTIAACDACRIQYVHTQSGQAREKTLREQYGLVRPEKMRLIRVGDTGIPMGHYGVISKDIIVPAEGAGPAPAIPRLQF